MDPEGRILAARVFTSHLALIPLVKATGEEFDHGEQGRLDALRSHTLNFSKQIDSRLKNIRQIEFLPGFLNPTLAILYDRGSNCEQENLIPRSAVNQSFHSYPKETCALMIVAIEPVKLSSKIRNSSNFQFTIINTIENIPWDCHDLFPLPKPVGGLFLTTTNMLLWCDISSSAAPHCIAVNPFASLTYSGRIAISSFINLGIPSLHGCKLLPIGVNSDVLKLLLITAPGEHFIISISRSGRTLGYFNMEALFDRITPSPGPSSIVLLRSNLLFISIDCGNAKLLKISQAEDSRNEQKNEKQSKSTSNKPTAPSKADLDDIDAYLYGEDSSNGTKYGPVKSTDDDYLASLEKEEARLYKNSSASSSGHYVFSVVDEIECLGPVIDMAVGCNENCNFELVTVGGNTVQKDGKFIPGSVNVITQRLPVQITANFSLPDTKQIWSINNESGVTKFLVATTIGSTLVLATSEAKIDEVEESAFFLEGPTVFCAAAHVDDGNLCILQIDITSMRLLDFNGKSQLCQIAHNLTSIKSVSCYRGGVLVLLVDGSLRDFTLSSKGVIAERITNLNGIAAVTIYNERLLFMVTEKGALGIFTVQDRVILFENSAFNRLPAALFNRLDGVMQVSELNQRIVALDVLDSLIGETQCFVIVRFESESDKNARLLASHAYRFDLNNMLLSRVSFAVLGKLKSGSNSVGSVRLPRNEVLLFTPALSNGANIALTGLTDRNFPRQHQLAIGEGVISIASYNDNSLLVLKEDGSVLIVDLYKYRKQVNLNWNCGLVLQRISLPTSDRVPSAICFHPPSKTYLVASAPLTSDFKLPADEYALISDSAAFPTVDGTDSLPKMYAAQSSALHLLNPIAWSFVDEAGDLFLPYETVSCMKTLELATQQTTTGFHPFITVGTAYQKSEDRPIRGRGIVFDVAEVVPEVDRPETNRKLRLKGITEFKGPVFAVTPLLDGNVAISLGQKVVIHTFEEDEKFAGVAFHDIGTCSLSLASLKNFFVTADLTKSVAFLAFQAEPLARIHALGRDYGQNLQCSSVEFLVNSEGQAMIVTADDQGGLHFFSYAPASKIKARIVQWSLIVVFCFRFNHQFGTKALGQGKFLLTRVTRQQASQTSCTWSTQRGCNS